jgi:hypothetical protein
MEAYKKEEDKALWELHEIRHELHKELRKKAIDEINKEAFKKYQNWQKDRKKFSG